MAQLLSNLPIGAKVKFGAYNGKILSWLIASTNGTLILEYMIAHRAFDAIEGNFSSSPNYKLSNIRQWLNSDGQTWYSPAHSGDAPPAYETEHGFLYYFSQNEKNALQKVTIWTSPVAYSGANAYSLDDKVYLPSVQDVSTNQYSLGESTLLPLFENTSHLLNAPEGGNPTHWWLRTPSPEKSTYVLAIDRGGDVVESLCYYADYGVRPCVKLSPQIKVSDTTDEGGYYTIVYNTAPDAPSIITVPATVYGGKSNSISWSVANDPEGDSVTYKLECSINGGTYSQIYSGASTTYPHLVPFGTTSVAYRVKATDPSGESSAYTASATKTVVNNHAPVISGTDSNLGVKSSGFTGTYTITDANNNAVTVTEAIDGVQIRSLVATLGQAITYGVTENTWLALPNGSHTLTIRATDGIDSAVRTYTFTKLVESFTIRNSTPWVSSTPPSRIMLVITRNIPSAATFKVEVCNNGYDSSPTWEDCTDAVKSGRAHVFANKSKTATNWGVLVRVTVARNGATGACYVSAIGGNFE